MRANRSFFGKKFEKIAIEKNMSQQDVANKLGVSKEMISIWVTGRRNPSLNSIKKIAAVFDVPTDYFIEENKNISDKNLDDKDIKILQLEKENLELKLQIERLLNGKNPKEVNENILDFYKKRTEFSDSAKKNLREYIEKFKNSKISGILRGKRLVDFLGNRYEGYKDLDAINKLLETEEGYVPEAFERDYFGKITLIWGQEFKGGLSHIIKRRKEDKMTNEELEKFLKNIPDVIKTGKISFNENTQHYEITKDKKIMIIDILMANNGIKFLLSGFKEYK